MKFFKIYPLIKIKKAVVKTFIIQIIYLVFAQIRFINLAIIHFLNLYDIRKFGRT